MDEVSAAQAAVLTGFSERTIRRKIASGKLPARRIGPNRFAIAVEDLPRRRDINELLRQIEALERRVVLLEERQHILLAQDSWDAAATGAEMSALAAGTEPSTSEGDLAQLLVQLAHEVERLTPLLAPTVSDGETEQDQIVAMEADASARRVGTSRASGA